MTLQQPSSARGIGRLSAPWHRVAHYAETCAGPGVFSAMVVEGGGMADFVKYELEDGSEVFFESAEASLVSLRGGSADVVDAGKLGDRLSHIAAQLTKCPRGCGSGWRRKRSSLSSG